MTDDTVRMIDTITTETYKLIVRKAEGYRDSFKIFRQFHDVPLYCANQDAAALIVAIMQVSGCELTDIAKQMGKTLISFDSWKQEAQP